MASATAPPRFTYEATRTVLPKTVVPSHYALSLQVDPAHRRFDGQTTIDVAVTQPVGAITLHARDLRARRVLLPEREAGRLGAALAHWQPVR